MNFKKGDRVEWKDHIGVVLAVVGENRYEVRLFDVYSKVEVSGNKLRKKLEPLKFKKVDQIEFFDE